jgi:hypothetical protein
MLNAAPTGAERHLASNAATFARSCFGTPGALILAISGCVAASIFLLTEPRHYSGDTNSYFIYSVALSKLTINAGVYYRQAGYPWLITATLYPWTKSVLGILAVQAVLAALIPWLIYRISLYVSKPLAIFGGLLSIVSLLPYLFQTLLFPDQTQVFLNILFCCVLIKYWFESTTRNMIWMFVVYACISFFRLPFLLLYLFLPLVVGVAAWIGRKERGYSYYLKPLAVLSIGVACLHGSASALDAYFYAQAHRERPSMNGKMVFLNSFINSVGVKGAFEDGKYTTILRSKLVDFFRNAPPDVRDIRNLRSQIADQFIQYQSDPERMVDAIMSERTNDTWWILFNISDRYFGKEGDPLFMKVALEQYRLHPGIFLNMLKRGFGYYLGLRACEAPPSGFPAEYECSYFYTTSPPDEYIGFPHFGPYTGVKAYTERLIGPKSLAGIEAPFITYATTTFPHIYRAMILLGALFTGAGLLFASYRVMIRGELRKMPRELPVLLAVVGVYLMYVGPMIILTDPEFRYVSAGVLFLLMSGLLSLWILLFQVLGAIGAVQQFSFARSQSAEILHDESPGILRRNKAAMSSPVGQTLLKLIGALVVVLAAFGITLWVLDYWGTPQESGLSWIHVVEATYGKNCNGSKSNTGQVNVVNPGNATADAAKLCDAKSSCTYTVTSERLGDPANGCGKDFTISWRCDTDQGVHQASVPGEAGLKNVTIVCPAQ